MGVDKDEKLVNTVCECVFLCSFQETPYCRRQRRSKDAVPHLLLTCRPCCTRPAWCQRRLPMPGACPPPGLSRADVTQSPSAAAT